MSYDPPPIKWGSERAFAIVKFLGISWDEFVGNGREERTTIAREIVSYALHRCLGPGGAPLSAPEASRVMGRASHGIVLRAVLRIDHARAGRGTFKSKVMLERLDLVIQKFNLRTEPLAIVPRKIDNYEQNGRRDDFADWINEANEVLRAVVRGDQGAMTTSTARRLLLQCERMTGTPAA